MPTKFNNPQRRPGNGGYGNSKGGGYRGDHEQTGGPIPSPYNFIPLSENISTPDWQDIAFQDIPFSDGISGWLDIKIQATTPIYTRNAGDHKHYRAKEFVRDCEAIIGNGKGQPNSQAAYADKSSFQNFASFYQLPDDRYAIPGTSIKGPIRTLIQILTQSRITPIGERKYAVRDLNNRELYTNWMTKGDRGSGYEPKVMAGWLEGTPGCFTITPCEFARVEQGDLEDFDGDNVHLGQEGELDSKYSAWGTKYLSMQFDIDDKKVHKHSQPLIYAKAIPNVNGSVKGELVFTGQPWGREKKDFETGEFIHAKGSKHMEFVFYSAQEKKIPVSDQLFKDFKQTHSDEQDEPGEALKFWKPKLNSGKRVPIFYLAYPKGVKPSSGTPALPLHDSRAELYAFGLALMFRLRYLHTIREAVPASHQQAHSKKAAPDFAETLFGFQREDAADEGLKGRVSFGPAIASGLPQALPAVITVLSGPKPTFYPNYIVQKGVKDPKTGELKQQGKYNTLMDGTPRIRGWKFYPARKDGTNPEPPLPPQNEKTRKYSFQTATAFAPLPAGTEFTGRIHFHNLRPAELGALVWALTWGGNEACRHRLGMAKPLGYGCAKIKIAGSELLPNDTSKPAQTLDEVKAQFESWMESACPDWLSGPAVRQDLIGMARHDHGKDATLHYPKLKMGGANEFSGAKGRAPKRDHPEEPSYALRLWHDIPADSKLPQPPRQKQTAGAPTSPAAAPANMEPSPPPKPEKPIVTIEITGSKLNKNGKVVWKAKINLGVDSQNGSVCAPLPPDIAAGKIFRAALEGNDANNHQFRCIEESS